MILLDTDILVDAARGEFAAIGFLKDQSAHTEIHISVITHMEMLVGCRNVRESRLLSKFLESFNVVMLSADISRRALALLEQFRLSHGLLIPDALIAATALSLGYPLATKNKKHFRFIKELGLIAF